MKKIIDGSAFAGKKIEVLPGGVFRLLENRKFIPYGAEEYWAVDLTGEPSLFSNVTTWEKDHSLQFRIKEECEEYINFMKDYYAKTRCYIPDMENWYFELFQSEFLKVRRLDCHCITSKRFFRTMDDAEELHNKWGSELIRRFLFDVWE